MMCLTARSHHFRWRSSAGVMRLWSSPGSSGLHAQSAIEAWKRLWPTHAYNLLRTRCPLTENAFTVALKCSWRHEGPTHDDLPQSDPKGLNWIARKKLDYLRAERAP